MLKTDYDSEVLQIAREIETYLTSRPGSGDTLEGIIRFWLPRVRLEAAAAKVLQALNYLEIEDVVIREPLDLRPNAETSSDEGKYNPNDFYRLNPGRASDEVSRTHRV